jgi:hypothetical protein
MAALRPIAAVEARVAALPKRTTLGTSALNAERVIRRRPSGERRPTPTRQKMDAAAKLIEEWTLLSAATLGRVCA